jgi:hypothetical protein
MRRAFVRSSSVSGVLRNVWRLGVQPGTKFLRLERDPNRKCWILWTNANRDWTLGTFMRMYDNGRAERVTLRAEGTEEVFDVRPAD